MVRSPCCEKMGLKKGPWTAEEDHILISFIQQHGHGNWRVLPKQSGLLRCGKSCRLRWTNYLRPDIKRGNFSKEEEDTIIKLHQMLGNRWSAIARRLPGRTDNEIKNVWHTHLKKKLRNHHTNSIGSLPIVPNRDSSSSIESKPMESQNSNPPEIESRRPRYAAVSPQNSSGELPSEIKDEQTGSSDALPQFFETGSTGKSISDSDFLGFNDGFEFRLPLSPATTNPDHYSFGINDCMEFWYNLFVSAGGQDSSLSTLLNNDDSKS